jgi:hypothetical protein
VDVDVTSDVSEYLLQVMGRLVVSRFAIRTKATRDCAVDPQRIEADSGV